MFTTLILPQITEEKSVEENKPNSSTEMLDAEPDKSAETNEEPKIANGALNHSADLVNSTADDLTGKVSHLIAVH